MRMILRTRATGSGTCELSLQLIIGAGTKGGGGGTLPLLHFEKCVSGHTSVYIRLSEHRGSTTRCRVQKITCFSTGSRHQYIVI